MLVFEDRRPDDSKYVHIDPKSSDLLSTNDWNPQVPRL